MRCGGFGGGGLSGVVAEGERGGEGVGAEQALAAFRALALGGEAVGAVDAEGGTEGFFALEDGAAHPWAFNLRSEDSSLADELACGGDALGAAPAHEV